MDDKNLRLVDIVPEYGSKMFLVRRLFWDRISTAVALGRLNKKKKILDLGAGSGNLVKTLVKKRFPQKNIFALDFNKNFLELQKSLGKVNLKVADIDSTGYADDTFDTIFCLDVLEHIPRIGLALKEVIRISKDRATLVVSIPKENFLYKLARFAIKGTFSMEKGPGSGEHYYTYKDLIKLLSNHFELIEIKRLRVLGIFNFFTVCSFKVVK